MRVYEAITDAFVAEGVDTVFSLMGDSNMLFHHDLVHRHGARVVNACHENAAVAMADGYARATGRVGVATVTCGPGITQATTALTAAARARVPLVVFAGDTPARDLWNPQNLDIGAAILPTGAAHAPIRSAERIAEHVCLAFLGARRDRRPVVITMPYDLQELEAPDDFVPRPSHRFNAPGGALAPTPAAVRAAAAAIMAAERPVIVAGRGAVEGEARDAIVRLAERSGALLATTLKAKDWFAGEPWDIGVCGYLGSETGRRLLAGADLVLGVGAQLGYFTTDGSRLLPDAQIVQVDLEPASPLEGTPFEGVLVAADCLLGVDAIEAALAEVGHQATGYRTKAVAEVLSNPSDDWVAVAHEPGRLDPTLAMRALDAAMAPDQQYVFGVGHFWSFAVMNSHRPAPSDYLYSYAFGSIGHALPVAIGATLGRARPTVLVEGDGSLLMHIAELSAVERNRLDLVIVVMNDGGYGSEIHKLRAKGGDGELARFHEVDLPAVAAGFGIESHRAADLDVIGALIRAQRQTRLPMLIEIPMARQAISSPTRRIWFPEEECALEG